MKSRHPLHQPNKDGPINAGRIFPNSRLTETLKQRPYQPRASMMTMNWNNNRASGEWKFSRSAPISNQAEPVNDIDYGNPKFAVRFHEFQAF
jgi:hypothetical protein